MLPQVTAAPADSHLPLLLDAAALAEVLSLSLRTVRRLDAMGVLPGRVTLGRAVRWRSADITRWVGDGLPGLPST